MEEKRTYTVKEIQAILKVSQPTAYRIVESGEFQYVRVGGRIRVSKRSFDEWLDRRGIGTDIIDTTGTVVPAPESVPAKRSPCEIEQKSSGLTKHSGNLEDVIRILQLMQDPRTAELIKTLISTMKE